MTRVTGVRIVGILLLMVFVFANVGAGCESDADKASENISKDAEQFKVARKIVGINGITDKVEFEVTGRCSIEGSTNLGGLRALEVICKEVDDKNDKKDKFTKHYFGLSDNMSFISTQLQPINVSVYRTKVILKPTSVVPDLDLVTG